MQNHATIKKNKNDLSELTRKLKKASCQTIIRVRHFLWKKKPHIGICLVCDINLRGGEKKSDNHNYRERESYRETGYKFSKYSYKQDKS